MLFKDLVADLQEATDFGLDSFQDSSLEAAKTALHRIRTFPVAVFNSLTDRSLIDYSDEGVGKVQTSVIDNYLQPRLAARLNKWITDYNRLRSKAHDEEIVKELHVINSCLITYSVGGVIYEERCEINWPVELVIPNNKNLSFNMINKVEATFNSMQGVSCISGRGVQLNGKGYFRYIIPIGPNKYQYYGYLGVSLGAYPYAASLRVNSLPGENKDALFIDPSPSDYVNRVEEFYLNNEDESALCSMMLTRIGSNIFTPGIKSDYVDAGVFANPIGQDYHNDNIYLKNIPPLDLNKIQPVIDALLSSSVMIGSNN